MFVTWKKRLEMAMTNYCASSTTKTQRAVIHSFTLARAAMSTTSGTDLSARRDAVSTHIMFKFSFVH